MITFRAFEVLVGIITGSRERETNEHKEFMRFYQELVKIVPEIIAKEFGSIQVPTLVDRKLQEGYRMELNVTDFLWWKNIIDDEGGRFRDGVNSVQRDIWDRLTKLVRDNALSEDERKNLLLLMSQDEPE